MGSHFDEDKERTILAIADLNRQAYFCKCLHEVLEAGCGVSLRYRGICCQLSRDRHPEALTRIVEAVGDHIVNVKVSVQRVRRRSHEGRRARREHSLSKWLFASQDAERLKFSLGSGSRRHPAVFKPQF